MRRLHWGVLASCRKVEAWWWQVRVKRECMAMPARLAGEGPPLPAPLVHISEHLAGLDFGSDPDYALLRGCLDSLAACQEEHAAQASPAHHTPQGCRPLDSVSKKRWRWIIGTKMCSSAQRSGCVSSYKAAVLVYRIKWNIFQQLLGCVCRWRRRYFRSWTHLCRR